MKPKLAKQLAKIALMGLGSVLIGTIIKTEKKLGEKIDAYYADETTDESQQDN